MESTPLNTIPFVLASTGCLQHSLVRVELTNGIVLTGRIVEVDATTMNMKLDAITDAAVYHGSSATSGRMDWEVDPAALRCSSSVVVRGCHVRYIDFIDEESSGGRGLQELILAARTVQPSLA